jgi:hypothetical protein
MHLDPFSIDQRHVLDEQTQNTFSLSGFDARIIPDTGKVIRQGQQLLSCLRVNQQTVFLCLLLVLLLCLGQNTELVIPFRFQATGDQTIIGINFQIAMTSKLSFVLCSLHVPPPQRVGFGKPRLNFLLHREGDL